MRTTAPERTQSPPARLVLLPRARPRLISIVADERELLGCAELTAHLQRRVDALLVHCGSGDARLRDCEARMGALLHREEPDVVLVHGASGAALAAARAASERFVPLVRLDAGVRSGRDDTAREHNRVLADHLADLLFAPTARAAANLRDEGVRAPIHLVGDVTCDALTRCARRLPSSDRATPYTLVVLADDDDGELAEIAGCVAAIAGPVLLVAGAPVHARIRATGIDLPARVRSLEAPGHEQQIALQRDARAIVSDDGDVQREAYVLGVPCVTLAEGSEWPETVEPGWNTPAGTDRERVVAALARRRPGCRPPLFGDGHAASRVADLIYEFVDRGTSSAGRRWAG